MKDYFGGIFSGTTDYKNRRLEEVAMGRMGPGAVMYKGDDGGV